MANKKLVFFVLIITAMFLMPINFSFESNNGHDLLNDDQSELTPFNEIKSEGGTRGEPAARTNYEIQVTSPVSMPEVNGTWRQDDWSGGPGQDTWSNETKFSSSDNLNYSTVDGHLELAPGGPEFDAWKQLNDGPTPRQYHEMVYAPSRDVFYSFAGQTAWNVLTNDLLEYNPANDTWRQIGTSGAPTARLDPVVVWDSVNDLLWVFGGRGSSWNSHYDDLWQYNPATDTWFERTKTPTGRYSSTGVFNPITSEIIIYGGIDDTFSDPSDQVWLYNTSSHTWNQGFNFTARYWHSGVWCPKTNSMFVYGGYSGGYITTICEYDPFTKSWQNYTGIGNGVKSIMAYDTLNEKVILYGRADPSPTNETWYFDPITHNWEQKLNSPAAASDSGSGNWDPVRNQFIAYGGAWGSTFYDEVYAYFPNTTGFAPSSSLISSVFEPGHRLNLRTVKFEVTNLHPNIGNNPVRIKLAGSDVSAADADTFIGPSGSQGSYFYESSGQATPASLDGSKYLAYKLELTTESQMYTPHFNWIEIDYYTYPNTYVFISNIHSLPTDLGLPLRYINWTGAEPAGTELEVSIRQSVNSHDIDTKAWEQVSNDQSIFGYRSGKYIQYKAVLTTAEPGYTPVMETIKLRFDLAPNAPELTSPLNNTWVGDSKPVLEWNFSDPDGGDYQTEFDIMIGSDEAFTSILYTISVKDDNTSLRITEPLSDGTYFWKVRTSDNYGSWGEWSTPSVLKIDTEKPEKPVLECFSHPLEYVWYNNDRPTFDWYEPYDVSGIGGYSHSLDQDPEAEPSENISVTVDEFELKHGKSTSQGVVLYDKIEEGLWYFHVRAVDSLGSWSDTATRTVRIDTSAPTVTDLTPLTVSADDELKFRFNISDSASGIKLATISWRYPSEVDYRFDELILDNTTGEHILTHTLEPTSDSYIEYYVTVTDFTEPANEIRYPSSSLKKVSIIDPLPPKIVETPGNIVHNRFNNLEITVRVTDNVGIYDVKVFFNDQSNGRSLDSIGSNKYSITIDRVEFTELAGYAGDDLILYRVQAWDFNNNTAAAPVTGNYNVTLFDLDKTDGDDKKDSDDKGFSSALMFNIIIMVVIIAVVAVVLFFFIKKQKKDIGEDRHKLRMAIADAQDAASAGGAPAGSLETAPAVPGAPEVAGLPPAAQQAPAGYLPEAPQPAPVPTEYDPYQQAGLMTDPALEPQPTPTPEQPPVPEPAPEEPKQESKVDVGDGLSISLPGKTDEKKKQV
jgi:hypothetical protein